METGPYNTPLALAREPFTAAFWTLCAPILFPYIGMVIAVAFWPEITSVMSDDTPDPGSLGILWTLFASFYLVQFAVLSLWSEKIGAGAFAGSMRASQNWILAGCLLGPVILLGPNLVADAIFGATRDWEYSSDVNEALFAPESWGPAYLALAILLAPILEEVTFRGVALGTLISRGMPPLMASVLSSAAFTAIHLQYSIPALCVVFIAGLGFSWLRLASGSIIVPIIAHIMANSVITFLASLAPPAPG